MYEKLYLITPFIKTSLRDLRVIATEIVTRTHLLWNLEVYNR